MLSMKNTKTKNKGKNPCNPGQKDCHNGIHCKGLLEEWIANLKAKKKLLIER
jgi:hypothetical protein